MADPVTTTSPDADGLVGAVSDWPCLALPGPKYLWAEGQILKRSAYSLLFQRYGTQFNTGGEAGDEFRIPNRKGRFPVGQDPSGTIPELDTVGETGGTVAATQPQHNHGDGTLAVASHTHPVGSTTINNPASGGTPTTVLTPGSSTATGATAPDVTGNTADSAGSGNNLPPYQVTRYIVKVL